MVEQPLTFVYELFHEIPLPRYFLVIMVRILSFPCSPRTDTNITAFLLLPAFEKDANGVL